MRYVIFKLCKFVLFANTLNICRNKTEFNLMFALVIGEGLLLLSFLLVLVSDLHLGLGLRLLFANELNVVLLVGLHLKKFNIQIKDETKIH